jgi:hypothetical protein
MVKQMNGFWCWLGKIRMILGVAGILIGTISVTILGYAAMCSDITAQGVLISEHRGEIKVLEDRVDTHTLAILKVQTQLDIIQQRNQEYQEEARRNFRQIIDKLNQSP